MLRFAHVALILACLLPACRKDVEDDARLLSEEETIWYDSFGRPGECDAPAKTCKETIDAKGFIERCVAEGHRARTCGCTVRCSGKIAYGSITVGQPETKEAKAPEGCPRSAKAAIASLARAADQELGFARCIENYLCNGRPKDCESPDIERVRELRQLAAGQCAREVVGTFCPNGHVESFACDDETTVALEKAFASGIESQGPMRGCLQDVICNDRASACTPAQARQAREVKRLIETRGCSYWFEVFCRI